MRIEKDIAAAYREAAGKLAVPPKTDERTRARIDRWLEAKPRRTPASRRRTLQFALVGSLALLIMGFTAQYFIRIGDDRFSLEISNSDQIRFDARTASVVRQQLRSVASRLAVGEKALVYSREIDSLLPNYRDSGLFYAEYASNPYLYTNDGEWKDKMAREVPRLSIPDEGEFGLIFVSGKEEMAYGGNVYEADTAKRLQAEVLEEGKALAWEKVERSRDPYPAFTTAYADANGNELSFTVQVFSQKSKYVGLTQAQQEKIRLNDGRDALYALNDKFLYSDSNRYASLSWIDTQAEATVLYTLGSSSPSITKEWLIAVAESMTESQVREKPAA